MSQNAANAVQEMPKFASFAEFYPYYLSEHSNKTCRRFHVVGTVGGMLMMLAGLATQNWWMVPSGLVFGYANAWVGHFVFEKNKPASFKYPGYSFLGDWMMLKDILRGKVSI